MKKLTKYSTTKGMIKFFENLLEFKKSLRKKHLETNDETFKELYEQLHNIFKFINEGEKND